MEAQVKKSLIRILKDSIHSIQTKDLATLRSQSDKLLNNPITFQDEQAISTAILLYSIFKVLEKHHIRPEKIREFNRLIIKHLKIAIKEIKQENITKYNHNLKEIISKLNKLEKDMNLFIELGIKLTKVKKASKLYGQGVSLGTVAELLDTSKWDVMQYTGKTPETKYKVIISPIDRIKNAKSIFGIK